MKCSNPMKAYKLIGTKRIIFEPFSKKRDNNPNFERLLIPCGNCLGCRMNRSSEWAVRCVNEAQAWEPYNCFITLTYNKKNIAENNSLVKEDFVNFMKRLRRRYQGACKIVDKQTGEITRPIRFFHCGEYGTKYDRPHHHSCIFNWCPDDLKLWSIRDGVRLYRSTKLENLWTNPKTKESYGYATVGEVTWESAAYVARYIYDKQTGEIAKDVYKDRVPPYVTCSNRPGIGRYWYEKFKQEVITNDNVEVNGKEFPTPRYYDRILEEANPKLFEKIKKARKERHDNTLLPTLTEVKSRKKINESRRKLLPRELKDENQRVCSI